MKHVIQTVKLSDSLHCKHISGTFDNTDYILRSRLVRAYAAWILVRKIAADGAVFHLLSSINYGLRKAHGLFLFHGQYVKRQPLRCFAAYSRKL